MPAPENPYLATVRASGQVSQYLGAQGACSAVLKLPELAATPHEYAVPLIAAISRLSQGYGASYTAAIAAVPAALDGTLSAV